MAYALGYLADHPCVRCGYDGPAKQFHHRDPARKDEAVSRMVQKNYGLARIRAEIDKCDVLCCVCHTEYHVKQSGERPFWALTGQDDQF